MIVVEALTGRPVQDQAVEIVERKGRGHPDTICDSIAEAIGVALCAEYVKTFGRVMHYNIDKSLLAAGRTSKRFGGGRVVKPMELIVGDRATFRAGGRRVDVEGVAVGAAKGWIRENLRFVDPERHVRYRSVLAPGSEELAEIFLKGGGVMAANDTSVLAGYYPLTPTEGCVLALERYLNSRSFKRKFPHTGEDVKVMGLRKGRELALTVAMPLIARFVGSEEGYFTAKEAVVKDMGRFLRRFSGHFKGISVGMNTLDGRGRGLGGIYLSLLGTSAEDADSGQVGRGNRVNGLIAIKRPMSTEAAAGKNCQSHVGKIYNVLAHRCAERICRGVEGVREAHVFLLSRIGMPVDTPHMATAQVRMQKGRRLKDARGAVRRVVEKELAGIPRFCRDLAMGRYPVV